MAVLITDQLLKYLSVNGLLPKWEGLFDSYLCNQNLAWGIPIEGHLFIFLWLTFALYIGHLLVKKSYNLFLLLILSGSISNIIDRSHLGCVVDFIRIGSFPVFNLADICISFGIVLFFITEYQKENSPTDKIPSSPINS